MRRVLPAAALLLLSGCADVVDTELGLDATVDAARVSYASGVVSASIDVTYRVGEHAEDERVFQPQAIDLFVGEELVTTLSPTPTSPDFDAALMPGESASATLEGGMSGVTDPMRLCGAEVRVLFRWVDQTTLEIGMTETVTTDVTCE